jgi:hypothetical protein
MSIALLFCLPVVLPANAQEAVPAPAPLPKELEDYYWSLRTENNYWLTSILIGISLNPGRILRHGLFSPYDEFQWLKFAIEHDAGLLGTETSKMAGEYLEENVIEPIKKDKAIKMMNGHIVTGEEIKSKYAYLNLNEEEMDRLVLAELLFLYVREYVYFPPGKAPGNNRYEESVSRSILPANEQLISFYAGMGLPQVLSFPAEAISMQQGICWQQATALAALYKMTGYDFALYLVPAAPFNPISAICPIPGCLLFPIWVLGGYHGIVMLKDEWGLDAPHMSLEEDSMGNELGGEYLMLDPMYDYIRARGQAQGALGALAGTAQNLNVETLEEMDALPGVYGFLEPSPYLTQMMMMHTIVNIRPLINTKFVGKV